MTATTKAAHTPGPWDYFVGNADGRGLIRIEQHGTGEHIASMQRGPVSEANAGLIAAAPEMKSELADIADYCTTEINAIKGGDKATFSAGQVAALLAVIEHRSRTAIAKATGAA